MTSIAEREINTVRLSKQYQLNLHKKQLFKSIPQKSLIVSWNGTEITATPVQCANHDAIISLQSQT